MLRRGHRSIGVMYCSYCCFYTHVAFTRCSIWINGYYSFHAVVQHRRATTGTFPGITKSWKHSLLLTARNLCHPAQLTARASFGCNLLGIRLLRPVICTKGTKSFRSPPVRTFLRRATAAEVFWRDPAESSTTRGTSVTASMRWPRAITRLGSALAARAEATAYRFWLMFTFRCHRRHVCGPHTTPSALPGTSIGQSSRAHVGRCFVRHALKIMSICRTELVRCRLTFQALLAGLLQPRKTRANAGCGFPIR